MLSVCESVGSLSMASCSTTERRAALDLRRSLRRLPRGLLPLAPVLRRRREMLEVRRTRVRSTEGGSTRALAFGEAPLLFSLARRGLLLRRRGLPLLGRRGLLGRCPRMLARRRRLLRGLRAAGLGDLPVDADAASSPSFSSTVLLPGAWMLRKLRKWLESSRAKVWLRRRGSCTGDEGSRSATSSASKLAIMSLDGAGGLVV